MGGEKKQGEVGLKGANETINRLLEELKKKQFVKYRMRQTHGSPGCRTWT